ncbi:MAG: DUF2779 domain-containing protein, partial [Candidatus Margulisbacteria bacterium]|nr:DUF2779 domain-containing protein [Candidatus Margulisiibacteriota bacterium]
DERMADLLAPFKNFSFYHPAQMGSASLKNVLPAVAQLNYSELAIGNGGAASAEYYRVTFGSSVPEDERQKIRLELEKYCNLDTTAMIDILEALKKAVQA